MEKNVEFKISGIKCDNKTCDYNDMSVKFEDYLQYMNKPCPKCDSPLLTQEQYEECIAFQKIADTINSYSDEQINEFNKNISKEDTDLAFQLLTEAGFNIEIKDDKNLEAILICKNKDNLPGNSIAPELELYKEYKLMKTIICNCGSEHYDVGLKSEYNYISCYECKAHIKDGYKIHWCHPSRFIKKQ